MVKSVSIRGYLFVEDYRFRIPYQKIVCSTGFILMCNQYYNFICECSVITIMCKKGEKERIGEKGR